MLRRALEIAVKQPDTDVSDIREAWEVATAIRDVVFATIESTVILAAITIAIRINPSVLFWGIYAIAWSALALYILSSFRYAINVLAAKTRFSLVHRDRFLWVMGALGLLFSIGITFTLPNVIAAFVEASFMQ